MITVLGRENSLLNQYIAELRDSQIQTDSMRFRRNLERAGEIFAYEISKTLPYVVKEVQTPFGVADVPVLKDQPVIAAILRAALPFHGGLLNYFDKAENAFISAYRKHHKDGSFEVKAEYLACPDLNGKILILADPLLATASSLMLSYRELLKRGRPSQTHIVTLIASVEGMEQVKKNMAEDIHFWIGTVDQELTTQAYIVPGLGDAGDLAFGGKA